MKLKTTVPIIEAVVVMNKVAPKMREAPPMTVPKIPREMTNAIPPTRKLEAPLKRANIINGMADMANHIVMKVVEIGLSFKFLE